MRTTIDIPEDILRRAKATAAIRGIKLKDLIATLLDNGLKNTAMEPRGSLSKGQHRDIPVSVDTGGIPVRALSNKELEELFLAENVELRNLG